MYIARSSQCTTPLLCVIYSVSFSHAKQCGHLHLPLSFYLPTKKRTKFPRIKSGGFRLTQKDPPLGEGPRSSNEEGESEGLPSKTKMCAVSPATEAPAAGAPAHEVPAAEVPATEVPAAEAPATEVPVSEAPAHEVPAPKAPATEVPATEVPAAEVPVTDRVMVFKFNKLRNWRVAQITTDRTHAARIPCERLSEQSVEGLFHGLFLVGDLRGHEHAEMNLRSYEYVGTQDRKNKNPTNPDDIPYFGFYYEHLAHVQNTFTESAGCFIAGINEKQKGYRKGGSSSTHADGENHTHTYMQHSCIEALVYKQYIYIYIHTFFMHKYL